MNLIFLDTETTGNDVSKDRLSQVCYRTEEGGVKTEYFKPPIPMSVKSMSITHITNKMLEGKQSFADSQMKKDLEILFKDGVLVAHNAKFDVAILEAEGLKIPKYICTYKVAQHLDEKGVIPEYNLQFLRYYLDLEVEGNAHDAEGDVNVLYAIFERLLQKMIEVTGDRDNAIQTMIEISTKPTLYKIFSFGKHKGKTVEEVVSTDKGYIDWLYKTKLASGEEDDWIFTIEHHLKK